MPAAARSTCNCRCGAVQIANICEPRSLLFLRSALRSGEATPWKKSAGRRSHSTAERTHGVTGMPGQRPGGKAKFRGSCAASRADSSAGFACALHCATGRRRSFSLYVQKLYMYTVYIKNIYKCIDIDSPRSLLVHTSTDVSAACTVNTQPLLAISNCIRYPSAHTRL